MSNDAPLQLTPLSKRVLRDWGKNKTKAAERIIDHWGIAGRDWLLQQAERAFDEQKQMGGGGWQENKGRYAEWKAQAFKETRAGFLNGHLRKSIHAVYHGSKKEIQVGSPVEYAPYFNSGTSKGAAGVYVHGPGGAVGFFNFANGIPARPFLPEKKYAQRHLIELFNDLTHYLAE